MWCRLPLSVQAHHIQDCCSRDIFTADFSIEFFMCTQCIYVCMEILCTCSLTFCRLGWGHCSRHYHGRKPLTRWCRGTLLGWGHRGWWCNCWHWGCCDKSNKHRALLPLVTKHVVSSTWLGWGRCGWRCGCCDKSNEHRALLSLLAKSHKSDAHFVGVCVILWLTFFTLFCA